MKLLLPFPPSANRYWRLYRGHLVVSKEAETYKTQVKLRALSAGLRPLAGEVAVAIVAFRPALRGDLDNLLKVTLDALQGVAYRNDDQVAELSARRELDRDRPRLQVEVSECR